MLQAIYVIFAREEYSHIELRMDRTWHNLQYRKEMQLNASSQILGVRTSTHLTLTYERGPLLAHSNRLYSEDE
jgi:hypothetical protein